MAMIESDYHHRLREFGGFLVSTNPSTENEIDNNLKLTIAYSIFCKVRGKYLHVVSFCIISNAYRLSMELLLLRDIQR